MLSGLEPRTRLQLLVLAILLLPIACTGGCDPEPRAGDTAATANGSSLAPDRATTESSELGDAGTKPQPPGALIEAVNATDAGAHVAPWAGPFFTVTSGSVGLYAKPSADRGLKMGYARSGGRLPVMPDKVSGDGCRSGWYELVGGGYVCGAEGTIDPEDPRARLAVQAPDLSATLPYPYGRNAQNGTPLYSSVPSRDQMAAYEPYLELEETPKRGPPDAGTLAWWQRKEAQLNEVRLAELALESDGVLARRLVKGFYIAIDKEFEWSSRTWYKSTKGMVAPKDRFVAVEGSDFRGVDLPEADSLPVAWAYGFRQNRPKYQLAESGTFKPNGSIERLRPIYLTGDPVVSGGHAYVRSLEGFWVRMDDVRIARPPPIPIDVRRDERWIYVDLRSQTLVALIGSTPVYATLVSSGRESDDEEQDHRTPPGQWNIREKHVTTTMDGDGTAAGDLPYSIEDVPYVMYFEGSYALHAAFWHRNYGVRMSHGCINLAPLDAKYVFFFTGPSVREGWHGAWSGNGQAGSRVVIDGPERGTRAGR